MPSSDRTFFAADGLEIAYTQWGDADDRPLVVLVHATGFCKEVCEPIVADLAALSPRFRAVAIDQRGHGDSAAPDPPFDWWDIARDVLTVIDRSRPVVGVGHSAGGAALAMAEMLQPGVFQSLVLVEPIIFPPPYGAFPDNPMSVAARRRRFRFPDRQAAYENWKQKPVFAGWDERALWRYVDGGLRPDGTSLVLKCSPDSEAETFMAATTHRAWDRLDEVAVDTLIIAGEHSTTHRKAFLDMLVDQMPAARYEIVPDTSHMVWMERPGLIADRVARII